ncbi:uncharacterized protein DUF4342 [Tumebacillus sp. BK434]|uniref:DUF4342 domain-containing protein n=1 Tax=Tumebacillus sp. BK434 TaxID=2512169 RepID=UPI00104663B5|nr:DUF4342 domain-containing protein [Tumebacillus sp. BK434]TCP53329.1 uncharacterized protein DUF4342 [Tumebacillus sp. BK434]
MTDPMLEKVDILRKRFQISYREAYNLLEQNDGNVVRACIDLEHRTADTGVVGQVEERMQVMGKDLLHKVQDIVRTGQASSIRVIRDGQTVLTIPAAVGVVGALIFPYLAVAGTAAAVAARYEIVIDKRMKQDPDTGHQPAVVNVHHESIDTSAVTPSLSSGKAGSMERVEASSNT